VSDSTATAPAPASAAPAKAAPARLAPFGDTQRADLFRELVCRFATMKPTHAPRERQDEPTQLSATYRAAAWAMDALKSAEEIWRREAEWRAGQQAPNAQTGGASDTPF
jgi:hypothetical protein